MRFIADRLRNFGLVALVAASTVIGCNGSNVPHDSVPYNNIRIGQVKRYHNGNVLNLNRLEVDWSGNEKCNSINPKYGETTSNLVYDNVFGILGYAHLRDRLPEEVFRVGFEWRQDPSMLQSLENYNIWQNRQPFVIESTQPESTLVRIGQQIYDNACNDPELSQ